MVKPLFLFIFESIGTSELILIGIVALIFLGPRKLPSIARTIGKTIADLRNTTNEFKSTWEREVNFEEEEKALRTGDLPKETEPLTTSAAEIQTQGISAPEIKQIDASAFDQSLQENGAGANENYSEVVTGQTSEPDPAPAEADLSDKKNWL